jgi:hypothetical protein
MDDNGGYDVTHSDLAIVTGSTSFESDADPLDGWQVPGAPAGSLPNVNDWVVTG